MCLVSQAAVSTLEFGNAALVSFFYHEKCKSLFTWMDTHSLYTCCVQTVSTAIWNELNYICVSFGLVVCALIWLIFLQWKFFNGQTLFHTSNKWFAKLYLREHSWKKKHENDHFVLLLYTISAVDILFIFLFWMFTIKCSTTTITTIFFFATFL